MSDQTPQVWHTLRANDARALIRFLVDVLGFEETVVHGDGDSVDHAQLDWPAGGGIMLGSVRPADGDQWPVPPGTAAAYIVAESDADIDALHERATAADTDITTTPHRTDYGSYDLALRDPEGNRWSFGTYRGEPRRG